MAAKENENETDNQDENIVRKTISIKGVSADLYRRIQKISSDTGKTIGQLTDDAYKSFMGTVENTKHLSEGFMKGIKEGSSQFIENIKELEITGDDLKEIGRKVIFKNIDSLTFKDVDNETFDKYVNAIVMVKTVTIPKNLSKTKVLVKGNFIDKIIQ
jgi:predicted DNA-binding protein